MRLSEIVAIQKQVFLTDYFYGPVDSEWRFVPLPTLHIHHVHVFNSIEDVPISYPIAPMAMYLLNSRDKRYGYLMEHHSEAIYNDPDGTVHSEGEPLGHGLLLARSLDVTLELNDYRPV